MTHAREPYVRPTKIADLRPTQGAAGLAEVAAKRAEWAKLDGSDRRDFLASIAVPVVVGPRGEPYLIDHHHEARALSDEGVKTVLTHVVADLGGLKSAEFFAQMTMSGWCHLFDDRGRPCSYKDLPRSISAMPDDPYRSLAGFLRRAGGCAKVDEPFAEFRWAAYLRTRVDDPTDLDSALRLAGKREAGFLPGSVRARSA